MLKLAIFISITCHLLVLFSLRQLPLLAEPAIRAENPGITARLASQARESASMPPAPSQTSLPTTQGLATPAEVLAKTGIGKRDSVFRSFSRSTATDEVAATEQPASASGASVPSPDAMSTPNDGISPDGVRQYRLNLAREARRFKQYPQSARERGWEGVAVVIVNTVAGATLPQVSLSQSSGFDLLDQEALALVAQAVNTAAVPESLRNRQFGLTLPIHYRLDD